MKFFFKLLWYKFFRVLEKNAIAPSYFDSYQMKKLNAFNGMAFSILLLIFNSITIYFIIAKKLNFDLSDSLAGMIMLVYLGVLLLIGNRIIMQNGNYIEIEKDISNSKYKGIYGSVIIAIYIVLTFIAFFRI